MRDPRTSLAPDTAAPVPDPPVPKPDVPDASNLLLTAGNLAVQQLFCAAQLPLAPIPFFAAPAPPSQKTAELPVVIHWSKYAPWLFMVDGSPSASAISIELYGFDAIPFRRMDPFVTMMGTFYSAEPELLRPAYQERYYQEMDALLKQDVEELESLIFDDHRVADGMEILRRWAGRDDLRLRGGRTYFDAFLARLRGDYWYRDYLVTTGAKHTFFDSLFDWAGDSAGEVSGLIAQHSREFGAYRPDWALVETVIKPQPIGPGAKPADGPKVNPELVTRTADLVLEKLSGRTSSDDSHVIADAMTSLPAAEQLSVIKDIIGRYDETKWLGLVGKYGEAGETGMLYWLFEDLTSEDRERVRKSVVENHVLTPDMAAALVSGRGAISRTLPWITGKIGSLAEKRVTFWADKAAKGESTIPAYIWGSLDALFLPQNIDTTVLTLMAPGAFKGVGALSPTAGRLLGLGLTGVGAYDATISLQQVISNRDAYSGEPLPQGGQLASALRLASDIILLGVGFRGARGARGGSDPLPLGPGDPSTALSTDVLPPETGLAVGTDTALATNQALATVPGEPQVEWRVLSVNQQTGDMTIIGRSGGEYLVVRMNAGTLDGEVLHPRTGQVVPIRGGFVTFPEPHWAVLQMNQPKHLEPIIVPGLSPACRPAARKSRPHPRPRRRPSSFTVERWVRTRRLAGSAPTKPILLCESKPSAGSSWIDSGRLARGKRETGLTWRIPRKSSMAAVLLRRGSLTSRFRTATTKQVCGNTLPTPRSPSW